jgi:methionyl aminopeptidase
MIHLKSAREVEKIRASCRIAAEAMAAVVPNVRPGVSTSRLDEVADAYIRSKGGIPSAKGYRGYPKSICISVNEEVVHGIPGDLLLAEGDILAVDIAVKKEGYHGDMNVSFAVGEPGPAARRLIDATRRSLELGIEACACGSRLGDVGHAIQSFVEGEGYSVVREYCGHGIGRAFHEEPQLLHFGQPNTGRRLEPGTVFTVEPMVNEGVAEVDVQDDNWTAVTRDGKLSAQFEHTVLITENGPDILSHFSDLPF